MLGGALGCGGAVSQARDYLKTAHEEGLEVSKSLGKLGKKTGQTPPENIEAKKKLYLEIVELIGAVKAAAEKTKSHYDKVLKLKDVKDYKDYASLKIKALDLLIKQMGLIGDLYAVISKAAEDEAAGRPVDQAAVSAQMSALISEIGKVEEETTKAKKDAADIGDELNLEFLKEKK